MSVEQQWVEQGKFFKKKREEAGITQNQMADKCGYSTGQYVSNIERGISPPSREFALNAMKFYKVKPREIATVMSQGEYHHWLGMLK